MPTLVYWDSDGTEKSFNLSSESVLVGRSSECAIRSDDTRVSRKHARITNKGEGCWIEDLESANGVYVGAEKVVESFIPPGEIAVIGSIILQLQPEDGHTTPLTNGTHTQLCVWLKIERESRAAVIEERNALGLRVSELHKALEQQAQGLTVESRQPSQHELEQARAEIAAAKDKEIAELQAEAEAQFQDAMDRARSEAEVELQEAVERTRAEAEAQIRQAVDRARAEAEVDKKQTIEHIRAEIEADKQQEVDALQAEMAELRAVAESSTELQKQSRQLWTNLRAAKQRIKQLEEEANTYQIRQAAEEETRTKLQEHARKLADEVRRLRELDSERGEHLAATDSHIAQIEERNTELAAHVARLRDADERAVQLAEEVDQLRDAEKAAWVQNDELAAEVERLRNALKESRTHSSELASLQEERDRLKFELDVTRTELDELRAVGADAENQYAAEMRSAQARVEKLSARLDEVRATAATMEQEAAARLAVFDDENARLRDNLSDANAAMYKLQGTLDRANAELEALRVSDHAREAGEAELAAIKRTKENLQHELALVRSDAADTKRTLYAELEVARAEAAASEEERARLATELAEMRGAEHANVERLAEAVEERQQIEHERDQLTEEVRGLLESNSALNTQLEAALNKRAKLTDELVEVRTALAEASARAEAAQVSVDEERQRLEHELAAAQAEVEAQRQQIASMNRTTEELIALLESAKSNSAEISTEELNALRERDAELVAELEHTRAQLEGLRQKAEQVDAEHALRQIAEAHKQALQERIDSLERDMNRLSESNSNPDTSGAAATSEAAAEQLLTLNDCIAALRASMRAASDETAVMPGDSASVQVLTDALSDATEQIEQARDALRDLAKLLNVNP